MNAGREEDMTRSAQWRGLAAVAAVAALWACGAACEPGDAVRITPGYLGMSLPADFRAFSDDSPWNARIAENPPIDPGSELMIQKLAAGADNLRGAFLKWTMPIHVVDSAVVPKVRVMTTTGPKNKQIDPDQDNVIEGMPIPFEAWPDPERDGHMVVVDPKARKSWEFSRVKKLTLGLWVASEIAVWDLDGPGYREPFTGPAWWTYGANGAGTPLLPGIIRIEEVKAGRIRHALLCATPVNRKSSEAGGRIEACPPASRTDGQGVGPEYIPEGARLQLDPAVNLESLGLSAAAKVVARAMQEYGMYVTDNAPQFKVYFQNLGLGSMAWDKTPGLEDIGRIPITSFRVLACDIRYK
jgi:hypothetical protein